LCWKRRVHQRRVLVHRAAEERRRGRLAAARDAALGEAGAVPVSLTARVAVATKGDGLVNEHFGHAREFQIYDVGRFGATLVGVRKVENYCQGGDGDEDVLDAVLAALADCAAVLVAKVGRCPRERLAAADIEPVERHAHQPIEASTIAWLGHHAGRIARGEVRPRPAPAPALAQEVA
ncbi:MAG TPA: NifB/NifX family molybdenum-iron cluster-binding protein, partial [Anaeromyxobacteraceae bacterium]|nr:NifB/NifX family molybdenum-iron cluster-binding protein [Anaeromyxobacteraceae bacterium]